MYPHHLHNNRLIPANIDAMPHEQKQIVEVILLRTELIHDIEAICHQLEKQRKPDEPLLLEGSTNDNYLLKRYMDTAINQAVARCQAYLLLPSPFVRRISADHVHGWEEKSIFIAMPMNWPPHCIDSLRDAIHNYIVERTLQNYLLRLDPKAAEASNNQAAIHHNEINALLNTRFQPETIGSTPFG